MVATLAPEAPVRSQTGPMAGGRDVLGQLLRTLELLAGLPDSDGLVSDAERIDRIGLLERVKAAAAGAQTAEIVRFAASQVESQRRGDVHPRVLGRGIADQIALACKVSPAAGSHRLSLARALWFDLPETYAALRAGQISEWVATLVSRETSHLDAKTRRGVDTELAGHDLPSLSPRRAAATARGLAYRADPQAAVERARIEEKQRRVTVRPAPDTMAILTAYLPAAQAIATWAALGQLADARVAGGDGRSRSQLMADSLIERVTGQTRATDLHVEVGLVMPIETLVRPRGGRPAQLEGYGPVPAALARDLLGTTAGSVFLRRLFSDRTGQIVGGDSRRRRFSDAVVKVIRARDQQCRDPFCDAPIRHIDHITRYADQGQSSLANGRGVCARGNYVRELPGWRVERLGSGTHPQPDVVAVTTPTGHSYLSRAPQPP